MIGWKNKFRFITWGPEGCAQCGADCNLFRPEDMAPEPVTLRVVLYGKEYNVTYPSQDRLDDLIVEFATMCKGGRKPHGNRKYFVCIHCGLDHFSNKMMLNRHRFIEGCSEAKYPDGRNALLLPYPDFKKGEGKKVEILSKKKCGNVGGSGAAKGHPMTLETIDPSRACGDDHDNAADDDARDSEDIEGEECDQGAPLGFGQSFRTVVAPPDLLWKEAPPRKNSPVKGGKGEKPGNAGLPKNKRKGSPGPRALGRKGLKSTDVGLTKKKQPRADIGTHIEAVKNLKKDRQDSGEFPVVGEIMGPRATRATTMALGKRKAHPEEECFHVSVRPPPASRVKEVTVDNSRNAVEVCPNLMEVVISKARQISLLRDRFQLQISSAARGSIYEWRKPRSISFADEIVTVSKTRDTNCTMERCDNPPETSFQGQRNTAVEFMQCHGHLPMDEDSTFQRNGEDQTESASPELKDDRVPAMVVSEGQWSTNGELLEFWADGKGSPSPFTFHPDLEERFKERSRVLSGLENTHVERFCRNAGVREKDLPEPISPPKPTMPSLYLLRQFEGEVTLPWNWQCSSGQDFIDIWTVAVRTDDFKDKLMRCAYWWSWRKVNDLSRSLSTPFKPELWYSRFV